MGIWMEKCDLDLLTILIYVFCLVIFSLQNVRTVLSARYCCLLPVRKTWRNLWNLVKVSSSIVNYGRLNTKCQLQFKLRFHWFVLHFFALRIRNRFETCIIDLSKNDCVSSYRLKARYSSFRCLSWITSDFVSVGRYTLTQLRPLRLSMITSIASFRTSHQWVCLPSERYTTKCTLSNWKKLHKFLHFYFFTLFLAHFRSFERHVIYVFAAKLYIIVIYFVNCVQFPYCNLKLVNIE